MEEASVARRRSLRIGLALCLAVLFVGLATLFVKLLQPLAVRPLGAELLDGTPLTAEAEAAPVAASTLKGAATPQPVEAGRPALPEPAPFAPGFKGPRIAILLTELGPNEAAARRAMELLPPEVSFSFSPYPRASYRLSREARAKGHEVWASVPMQPQAFPRVSPGRNTLLIGNSPDENLRRLDWVLARVAQPVGVTNMMGSAFTENAAALRPVMAELKARNLVYVDARSSGRSIGTREAKAAGVRAAANDRFLDEKVDAAAIDGHLAALEAYARRHGQAIGFARATSTTLERLDAWADGLQAKGMLLVPASTLTTREM